jgi:hypothetical protein
VSIIAEESKKTEAYRVVGAYVADDLSGSNHHEASGYRYGGIGHSAFEFVISFQKLFAVIESEETYAASISCASWYVSR